MTMTCLPISKLPCGTYSLYSWSFWFALLTYESYEWEILVSGGQMYAISEKSIYNNERYF